MPEASLMKRLRALLKRLEALVADRAERERLLREVLSVGTMEAERSFTETRARAESAYGLDSTSRRREFDGRFEALTSDFEIDIAELRESAREKTAAFQRETDASLRAAEDEYRETAWLAETLVESGEQRLKNEVEQARKGIESRAATVARERERCDKLLRDGRFAPLPEAAPAAGEPPEGATRESLGAAFDEAVAAVVQAAGRLERVARPRRLGLRWIAGVTLGAAVVAAGAARFAVGGEWALNERVGLAAGAGAGLGLLVMLGLKVISRRRVPREAARAAAAFSEAERARGACIARVERDRRDAEARLHAKRDREIGAAKKIVGEAMADARRRREVDGPALRERLEGAIRGALERHEREERELRETHERAQAALREARDAALAAAERARDEALLALRERDTRERAALEREWHEGMAWVQGEAAALKAAASSLCPAWDSPAWKDPRPAGPTPTAVTFGTFDVDAAALPGGLSGDPRLAVQGPTRFELPALLDFLDRGSLLMQGGLDSRDETIRTLLNVMLRLVTTFPPGKARFTIIDPVGLGQSFAGFMHLADHDPALVGDRIWTESKHIEQKLTDLTEHMENVIQKYLRNEYESIHEYNEKAGEVAEPFRFLIIADFPANFTESAAKRLASIVTSGPRCGVFTIVGAATREKPPAWAPIAQMERAGVALARREGRFAWPDPDYARWPLTLEGPPGEAAQTDLLNVVGAAAKEASRVRVPFEMVAPAPDALWSLSSAEEIRVPLGRAGAKKLQYMSLGRGTAQHALVAGRTGSGKSTLLHVMITTLALWYGPDEVELYLVDFKKGVEFKTYATHALPHARVIAVESEREFGISVLRRLDAELTRRGALFRDAGVQDVAGFRRERGTLPRVLLLVDEFQEFFVEDDRLAQEASLLLDRLVRQGRAFGMHVVLGSQTLGGAYSIARSTIGQMAVRVALQCSEADSYLIMSEDNSAARLLSRPGEAIYNDASGLVEGNSPFQVVYLAEETRESHLARVRAMLERRRMRPPPPAIVFEGNIPAEIASNHALAAVLASGEPPPGPPRAFLGEPISIKEPTCALFRRQGAANLLIVGQHDEAAAAMTAASTISLAAHGARVVLACGEGPDGTHTALLEGIAARAGARWCDTRTVPAAVAELAEEVDRRGREGVGSPLFFIVHALHRFRDLRRGDDFDFSGGEDGPAKQFVRILRDGPPLGVHVVTWCDTLTNLERTLDRAALREFAMRVLMQMSQNDSTALIDVPSAATLGRNRALFHSEDESTVEKFRPYAVPSEDWLRTALATFARAT